MKKTTRKTTKKVIVQPEPTAPECSHTNRVETLGKVICKDCGLILHSVT